MKGSVLAILYKSEMTVGDAAIEMGSLNSMCDKSGRDQVEHLTVRDKVALTLSLSRSLVCMGAGERHVNVCACANTTRAVHFYWQRQLHLQYLASSLCQLSKSLS